MEQINQAIELAKRGKFWSAIHLYEEVWIEAERQGDAKAQFNALNGLSNIANLVNAPAMARACLLKAWSLAEFIGDRRMLSVVAYSLAGLEFRRRDYQQAKFWLERCREIAEELDENGQELAFAYHGMAVLYEEIGELEDALECIKLALKTVRRTGKVEKSFRGALLSTKGSILIKLGRSREAVEVLEEALPLLEQAEVYLIPPLLSLAEAHLKLDEVEVAEKYYQRARSILKLLGETVEPDHLLRLREVGRMLSLHNRKRCSGS